jgi:hypothetical protein
MVRQTPVLYRTKNGLMSREQFSKTNRVAEFLLLLAVVGGLIALLVLSIFEAKKHRLEQCSVAGKKYIKQGKSAFLLFKKSSLNPYNGSGTMTTESVVSDCVGKCISTNCNGVTYNHLRSECTHYTSGILPRQDSSVMVVGPTDLLEDTYIRTGRDYVELKGMFDQNKST